MGVTHESHENEPLRWEEGQQAVSQERITKLVQLMEEDRIGYRLERHVAEERERLAAVLGEETFSLAPARMTGQDLARRVMEYDAATLPYLEYFAVGCAYGGDETGLLWAEFLERIATCAERTDGTSNDALRKAAFYPALVFLYAAGTLSVARRRFGALRAVMAHPLSQRFGEAKALVLHASSFDIIPEQVQKALPGREREYTPLVNHLHAWIGPALAPYFLSPSHFDAAFTSFEVLLAAYYAYIEQERERAQTGKVSDRIWAPLGRLGWLEWNGRSAIDRVTQEAAAQKGTWPPIVAGFFGGSPEAFLEIATKLKAAAAQRGY